MSTSTAAMPSNQTVKRERSTYDHHISRIRSSFSNIVKLKKSNCSGQYDGKSPTVNLPSDPSVASGTGGSNLLNLIAGYKQNLPIAEVLYDYLDFQTILDLFNTSKLLHTVLDNYAYHQQTRQWDINQRLKLFVNKPTAFRRMLAESKAIMCGTFALDFFVPSNSTGLNLDIIHLEAPSLAIQEHNIIQWLQEHEDYRQTPIDEPLFCDNSESQQVTCLIRGKPSFRRQEDMPMVRVIKTKSHLLEPILKSTGSTHLMNVIGTTTAYCFYANQTLVGKEMHLLNLRQYGGWCKPRLGQIKPRRSEDSRFRQHLMQFLPFGWQFASDDQHRSPFEPWVEHGTRAPCDSWTFRIPLLTEDVIDDSTVATVDDYIMSASWNASPSSLYPDSWKDVPDVHHPLSCAELHVIPIYHPCLATVVPCGFLEQPAYSPHTSPKNTNWHSWREFLTRKLEKTRKVPEAALTEEERSLMRQWLVWRSSETDPPVETRYYNSEICKWFLEWKECAREFRRKYLVEEVEEGTELETVLEAVCETEPEVKAEAEQSKAKSWNRLMRFGRLGITTKAQAEDMTYGS